MSYDNKMKIAYQEARTNLIHSSKRHLGGGDDTLFKILQIAVFNTMTVQQQKEFIAQCKKRNLIDENGNVIR